MKTENRNIKIEALRFVSMIMIMILHYFNQGHVLQLTNPDDSLYSLVWVIEGICYISVNIYMLISGYFLSEKKYSWRRLINFYSTVFFYSLTLSIGLQLFHKVNLDFKTILSVFPIVGSRSNWFVSVYFAILLISPFLNNIINSINQILYKRMLLIIFCLFSFIPTIFFWNDQFNVNDGYSILWYCFLYLLSAYVKKYGIQVRLWKLIIMILSIFFLPISKIVIVKYLTSTPLSSADNTLYAYNSVPVFLASFAVFILVINNSEKPREKKRFYDPIILFLGKVSFAVFFIHSFVLIRNRLWVFLGSEKYIGSPLLFLHAIISILLIYAICSVIDTCKSLMFKYCRIDSLLLKISNKLDERFSL